MGLIEVQKAIDAGNYELALKKLGKIEYSAETKERYYDLKLNIFESLGSYDEIIDTTKTLLTEITSENPSFYANIVKYRISSLFNMSKFDQCLNEITKYKEKLSQLSEKSSNNNINNVIADILRVQGSILVQKSEFEQSDKIFEEALKLAENNDLKKQIALIIKEKGKMYYYLAQEEKSIQMFNDAIDIFEELDELQEVSYLKNNLAVIYSDQGYINQALEMLKQCLKIHKESGIEEDVSDILNNLGVLHKDKGEITEARKYYKKSLEIRKKVGNPQSLAEVKTNLGLLHQIKEENEKARKLYLESLAIDIVLKNSIHIAEDYYNLISVNLKLGNIESAKDYLDRLEILKEENDIIKVHHYHKLSKAIYLKSKNRRVSKSESQKLLEELSDESNLVYDLRIRVLLNLLELLIDELEIYSDETILVDINSVVDTLVQTAKHNHSYLLLGELHILRSRLALLDYDYSKAKYLLTQAEIIAKEKNITYLSKLISAEFDSLLKKMENFEKQSELTMSQRIKVTEVNYLVETMSEEKLLRIENQRDIPVMLLLISKSGVSVYSKSFEEVVRSDQLVANFLTAINSFMNSLFDEKGTVERIRFKDYSVIMKTVESLLFCYIFKGDSFPAMEKMDDLIISLSQNKTIQTKLSQELPRIPNSVAQKMDKMVESSFIKS